MNVKVVTYYTIGNGYEKEVENFKKSASRLEIETYCEAIPKGTFKSWYEAVSYKPTFILKCLDGFKECDGVLWVDADAVFRMYPKMSIFDGYHLSFHKFKRGPIHDVEALTGTMFVANSPYTKEFVSDWIRLTKNWSHTETPEQHGLVEAMGCSGKDLNVLDLPCEFVWITDDFRQVYGERQPVIEHMQASRRLKGARRS